MHADPPSSPTILVIDTSTAQGSVALFDGERLSTRSWPADRTHTTTLLGEIHHLLHAAGIGSDALAAVGVATGPGAFTALRVGIGVAKGFHLAADTPLIGIATLEATALPFTGTSERIIATLPAGRGRLVWQHFASHGAGVRALGDPRNGSLDNLVAEVQGEREARYLVAGEIAPEHAAALAALPHVALPPAALRYRQPGAVAALAWRKWQEQDLADPTLLEPVYLSR